MKLPETYLDQFAETRYHKQGKCPSTAFVDGGHRVGLVPVLSVLDGGLPGDIAQEICMDCQRVFKKSAFYPKGQPKRIA
jgi:hypothetical protein